mgnify:CR=1 FL=1
MWFQFNRSQLQNLELDEEDLAPSDEVKVWFEATKEVMEELEVVEESVGKL